MPYTLAQYAEGIAALNIPGVVYDWRMEPPGSLVNCGLPSKYLRVPRQPREQYVFAVDGATYQGTGMMVLEVVIAIEALTMGFPEPNFRSTVEMTDALCKVLPQADVADTWPTLTCRTEVIRVADLAYWAVTAQVTARG